MAVALALGACAPSVPTPAEELRRAATSGADGGVAPGRHRYFEGEARVAALAEIARLKPIQARHQAKIMALPGVFAIGIGLDRPTGKLVFVVMFEDDRAAPALPATLEEVPVMARAGKRPRALRDGINYPPPDDCTDPCHAENYPAPVQMGNSGAPSPFAKCTLGFKACDASTGNSVFVTAAHCAVDSFGGCPGSAPIGSDAYHPSVGELSGIGPIVGQVAANVPPVANGTVDATSVFSDVSLTLPTIRDVGGPAPTPGVAVPEDDVQKSGRTTGHTTGVIELVNTTVSPTYDCGSVTLYQQIQIDDPVHDYFGDQGDSGAAVLDFSDPPQIVGMLISGHPEGPHHANDINQVLPALGLTLDQTACADTACPAIFVTSSLLDGVRLAGLIYRLRDEVLADAGLLRSWIGRFYDVAPAWLRLYRERPDLLEATRASLQANTDILESVVDRRPVTVARPRLNAVVALLGRHAQATGNAPLRAAFQAWQRDLQDPQVRAAFRVTVP